MNMNDYLQVISEEEDWGKDNPYVTANDLRPKSDTIAAIIYDDKGKILIFDHRKWNFYTIPVGKVEPGQKIEDALKREIKEECGINIKVSRHIMQEKKSYIINKRRVFVTIYLYEIQSYSGKPKNMEYDKHPKMLFLTPDEILRLPKRLSDATQMALRYLGK